MVSAVYRYFFCTKTASEDLKKTKMLSCVLGFTNGLILLATDSRRCELLPGYDIGLQQSLVSSLIENYFRSVTSIRVEDRIVSVKTKVINAGYFLVLKRASYQGRMKDTTKTYSTVVSEYGTSESSSQASRKVEFLRYFE